MSETNDGTQKQRNPIHPTITHLPALLLAAFFFVRWTCIVSAHQASFRRPSLFKGGGESLVHIKVNSRSHCTIFFYNPQRTFVPSIATLAWPWFFIIFIFLISCHINRPDGELQCIFILLLLPGHTSLPPISSAAHTLRGSCLLVFFF